ncbi:MAG: phosphoenolpyruvate carboxylase [Candidatus Omnitrophica bacterium]|nr:phosphoenolpyruvate carboxylase [Candidatus Omnitrophota bacterium]
MPKKRESRHFMDPELRRDIRFLTSLLGEIIREKEGVPFFRTVETIRVLAKEIRASHDGQIHRLQHAIQRLPLRTAAKVARAFTIYFQLVNLAEEAHRIRRIHYYEAQPGPGLEMSLTWTAYQLVFAGIDGSTFLKHLQNAEIRPVLTAHPTEVRRRTTMDHLLEVARSLEEWTRPQATLAQQRQAELKIRETLEILWATNETRQRKLKVEDEVSQVLFFMERTILGLVSDVYEGLDELLRFLDPDNKRKVPSILRFGSWVGADRDGNPAVTPEVTWNTALEQRRVILGYYTARLEDLIRRFSQADTLLPVSRALEKSLVKDKRELKEAARQLDRYEGSEVYRKKLSFMHTRILKARSREPGGYLSYEQFLKDLELIRDSLASSGSPYSAREIDQLIRQVDTFGFRLANLEYRDHRDRILQAVAELLPACLRKPVDYLSLSEADRQAVLRTVLLNPKAASCKPKRPSAVAADILAQFRTMGSIQREIDPQMAMTYLVSMTRSPSDILAVLTVGFWTGLIEGLHRNGAGCKATFDVVPLFETIPDLARSQEFMVSLWNDPVYKRYLAARNFRQQVMLGYSDANKDGGYLQANWRLYQAQARLSKAAARYGVKLVLFHGKGGSIDRGGGLSHRAILAQPFSAPGCRIKITEQGEVVAAKYSHPTIGRRNLEQLLSAVFLANMVSGSKHVGAAQIRRWEEMMEELAEASEQAYRALVFEDPDFMSYYAQATPIKIILEQPVAGTRPGARPREGQGDVPLTVERLRAIPWVFSWIQSRHMLSAWYGIGSAIETFRKRHGPEGFAELTAMVRHWPFAKVMLENAQASLAKAELNIARVYAGLVSPKSVGDRIFKLIEQEYHRSVREILAVTGSRSLLKDQPVLYHSIALRNPYVDPLHFLQVRGLKQFMKSRSARSIRLSDRRDGLLDLIRVTIHGISYGMKSTG